MSDEDQSMMAGWAYEYGQAVRQLSNRQTTTMKKMGALPDYISVRNVALGEKVILPKRSTASDAIEPSDEGVSSRMLLCPTEQRHTKKTVPLMRMSILILTPHQCLKKHFMINDLL